MDIVLRELNIEDGILIAKWRNSPEILQNCINRTVITDESFRIYYEKNIITGKYIQYMVDRYDKEMPNYLYSIGSVFLRNIDKINKRCELGILPSTDFEWNEEGKIKALKILVKKCFEEMGFHKIYSYMFADALEEIKMFMNVGFSKEAKLEAEILMDDGSYRDLIRMKICK